MYTISLSGRMFADLGVWAQLEAAKAFGYDAVDLECAMIGSEDELLTELGSKSLFVSAVHAGDDFDLAVRMAEKIQAKAVRIDGVATEQMKETARNCRISVWDQTNLPRYENIAPDNAETLGYVVDDFAVADGNRVPRRIGCGQNDWETVLRNRADADLVLVIDAVSDNRRMPKGFELAALCMRDVKALLNNRPTADMIHAICPTANGFHVVISPETYPSKCTYIFRLNMRKGDTYCLNSEKLEMNAVLIQGKVKAEIADEAMTLNRLDSFYIPGDCRATLSAEEDSAFIIGGAPYDGIGKPVFKAFVSNLADRTDWQVHGAGAGRRDVFFTLGDDIEASRLICGLTWGGDGAWTSWPPHQHEENLEEAYCYFDMPEPMAGMHYSYQTNTRFSTMRADTVSSGHVILVPDGYHPTCATPGTRNAYFWVMSAYSHAQRSYHLSINDANYTK